MADVLTVGLGALAVIGVGAWWRERREAARLQTELRAECAAEKHKLQDVTREQEEYFRSILASMAEGVVVVDRQREIRQVNPSLLRLFCLKQEPIGQTVLRALRLPLIETMVRAAVEEGVSGQEETAVQIVPSQSAVHLIVSTRPLGEGGAVRGAVTVIRDISRLRELEEVRREFVANVSHELRTPLAIFHGYMETLLDVPDMSAEERAPILQVMNKHSMRLKALVEDLLTLTRLESRRDPLAREDVDLQEFFAMLVEEWTTRSADKTVTFRADVEPGLPPVSLDPHRFRQVMDNLLDNALKYSPQGGSIELTARRDGDNVELRVVDHGAGIPPSDVPHIFERFYRADRARSRELGGTGLGLSIVKHIAQAHGGGVRAESVYGQGTTVILHFPLVATPERP